MDQQVIISKSYSPPPEPIKKWCDRWNRLCRKAGITQTNMAARTVVRSNGARPVYHLSIIRIGKSPVVCSFKNLSLDQITDDILRSATTNLMKAAEIRQQFQY
jgi:hypothetical protein